MHLHFSFLADPEDDECEDLVILDPNAVVSSLLGTINQCIACKLIQLSVFMEQ